MTTPRDLTRPLLAYWVGDMEIYAAESPEQALVVANAFSQPLNPYTLDDVAPVGAQMLDDKLVGADEPMVCTLRGLLQAQQGPGYLAGYE